MRPVSRGRKHGMNGLEDRYSKWLEVLKYSDQLVDWKFAPMGLKLAEMKCFYHPDFIVVKDHFEFHEVKAFSKKTGKPRYEDDSIVKLKVAARQFPWFIFRMVWYDSILEKWQEKEMQA